MKLRRLCATLVTLALAIAFFPVLNWYWLRLGNGSGEPFGLLALALAVGLALQDRQVGNLRLAEFSLLIYALSLFFLPPLLRSIPALATLAFLSGMHRQAGQFALLLLSLPVQASLDFFLGYPFRLITAEGSRIFINLLGYPVERLGVQLSLKGIIVSVDPPCSGLQMLWATALLSAILAALFRLSYRRSIQLGLIALALCLLANALRSSFLFFPESGLITLPSFAHEGIGLLFFALASLLLIHLARRFPPPSQIASHPRGQISPRFLTLACGVSLITFLPARSPAQQNPEKLQPLRSYHGRPVEEIALSPHEKSFAQNFPGQLKIYAIGHDTLIIRRITRASRMLHPSYHCFKAEGYAITHSQIKNDEHGHLFLSYRASRNGKVLHVREKIRDLQNQRQWTEVSAWYWHALLHPNSGPWEAETLITPIHYERTK